MKQTMTSILLSMHLMAVPCCFCLKAAADEILTVEQIEKLADRRVTAEVLKELDLREIATDLKFEWPVTPPSYSFPEHVERAEKNAKALAERRYPDTIVEEAKAEADKLFSVLRVGDEAKIRSTKPPYRVYEGRIQAITDTVVRIGKNGRIFVKDLDDDTLARFTVEGSKAKKEQFVKHVTIRMEANREAFVEENLPAILERELLEDGYAPITLINIGRGKAGEKGRLITEDEQSLIVTDRRKLRLYFSQSNWLDKSAVLQKKAQEEKQALYDEKIKETRENLFKSFGYEFDAMAGRWRLVNRLHDCPLTGTAVVKRSLWQKLRGR